jgi:eukaryotic-like serine/threonine-protein kinase
LIFFGVAFDFKTINIDRTRFLIYRITICSPIRFQMKLSPGTRLKHYEIRNLLGAGGMGEVYLAEDLRLGRRVAVKILTQTDDYEKMRRFRQEAKAISALNHPNILTIHEFDEADDFHFIVSEYVKGETLRDVLKQRRLPPDEIFDICAQIGNALAAAHEVGIIHRDIKPENVMILPDGYVKVLDFGLAKLRRAETPFENLADAPTASVIQTEAGLILGTVNYMSPEQLRGQEVDERTDIWALGAVFFEMLAGRKPFSGETVSDTIAAVLNQPLPEIADAAPEVEAVAAKALAKKKEDRFASAREFVAELKNLKAQNLSQNFSAAKIKARHDSPVVTETTNVSVAIKNLSEIISTKPKSSLFIVLSIFGLIFLAGAVSIYLWQRATNAPPKTAKFTRLSTAGNTTNAAISPDGRFIAYVQDENGKQSLWLRQTNETAGKELYQPDGGAFGNLNFAPDGGAIFFTKFAGSSSGTLYRIPILGGSQQEILKDIDSPVAFSRDGNKFAFLRSKPDAGVDRLIIAEADGTNERTVAEKKKPFLFVRESREGLAFSPDGKSIAVSIGKIGADEFMSVAEIEIESGKERFLTDQKWSRVGRVVWSKDRNFLFLTAVEFGTDLYQIVRLDRRSGETQKISNEITDFFNISLDGEAKQLLATTNDRTSTISIADSGNLNISKRLAGGGYDGIGGLAQTGDGRVVFVSLESGNADIWVMNEDGSNRRQLTFDKAADNYPVVARDNQTIVFVSNRTGTPHLWRMNFEGGDLRQLTDKGDESFPFVTPDGKSVVYSLRVEGRPTLWRVSIDGGEPRQITNEQTHWAAVSPDGKMIACLSRGTEARSPIKLSILASETGEFLKSFDYAGDASPRVPPTLRWLPDGKSVAFFKTENGVSNVFAQPVDGGELKKLTDFSADRIFAFDFSPDGKKTALARGVMRNDLLLVTDF